MNHTDIIYRRAIQRTFAELYGVPADAVHVAWTSESITVHCAGRTFTRQAGNDEFISEDEDPVTVPLSYDNHQNR
jgi:hypothetical protein